MVLISLLDDVEHGTKAGSHRRPGNTSMVMGSWFSWIGEKETKSKELIFVSQRFAMIYVDCCMILKMYIMRERERERDFNGFIVNDP